MKHNEYIISVFTENHAGVLNRITAVFLRRRINIESIKVTETAEKGISIITIIAFSEEEIIRQVVNRIQRIVDVLRAEYRTIDRVISQEIALYKVSPHILEEGRLERILQNHAIRVIKTDPRYVVIEKIGPRKCIDALANDLRREELLLFMSRSGSVILYDEEEGNINLS